MTNISLVNPISGPYIPPQEPAPAPKVAISDTRVQEAARHISSDKTKQASSRDSSQKKPPERKYSYSPESKRHSSKDYHRSEHRSGDRRDDKKYDKREYQRDYRSDDRKKYDDEHRSKRSRDEDNVEKKFERKDHSPVHQEPSKKVRKDEALPSNSKTHQLPMKGVIYLDNIKKGIKTFEGRICRGTCQAMRKGDKLQLRDGRANRGIECEITSYTKYYSFKEMLQANGILNMLPQLTELSKRATPEELLREAIKIYESFPGSNDVGRLGCVAIGVRFIKDI